MRHLTALERSQRGWLLALASVGLMTASLSGCSHNEQDDFVQRPGTARTAQVQGVLARSSSGAISLVERPLAAGFKAVSGATVQLVGSEAKTVTGPHGELFLPATASLARLAVTSPGATTTVIDAPAFSSDAGPAVSLEHFPKRFQLRDTDRVASRVVGVDARGLYLPVTATLTLADASVPPEKGLPSRLASPATTGDALRGRQIFPRLQATAGSIVTPDGTAGVRELQGTAEGLSGSTEVSGFSSACQASLSGRVSQNGVPLVGAIVAVDGCPTTVTTDSKGEYTFTGLAPLPSQVHVYQNNQLVALGFAPLSSLKLTRLDMPTRPVAFTSESGLPVTSATGIATLPSGEVYVVDGSSLREFSLDNEEIQNPPAPTPPAKLSSPNAVAADFSGEAYVADSAQNQVLHLVSDTAKLQVPSPTAIALDGAANVYARSDSLPGLSFFANIGDRTWADKVTVGAELLSSPSAIAVSRDGRIYVADTGNNRIAVLEIGQGGPTRLLRGDPRPGDLASIKARLVDQWPVAAPLGVALGPAGEVYVSSSAGVVCTDPEGSDPITVSPNPALGPIAIGPGGKVWVAQTDSVHAYAPTTVDVLNPTPPPPSGQSLVDATALAPLESDIQAYMKRYELPGLTLAISVNGRLVVWRGYGYSKYDLADQVPTQPDQLFRLASCSKTFTAAAVQLQMQDYPDVLSLDTLPYAEGGLLNGEVSGYDLGAGGFKDSRQPDITTAHLLRMTAGLQTSGALFAPLAGTLGGSDPPATAIEILLHIYSTASLAFAPGSDYAYSDVAYTSLGRLVEAVAQSSGATGTTYETYVKERLLPEVGITDMQIADTDVGGTQANEVTYYPFSGEACGQSIFSVTPRQVPTTYGASFSGIAHDSNGGWISSVTDLVKLGNALAPGQTPPGFSNPLDAAQQQVFSAPATFPGANSLIYFGCGWGFTLDQQGNVLGMDKDGGLPGTLTYVKYLLQGEDQVVYAYLVNTRPGPGVKKGVDTTNYFEKLLDDFSQSQQGQWPATGNLFGTAP